MRMGFFDRSNLDSFAIFSTMLVMFHAALASRESIKSTDRLINGSPIFPIRDTNSLSSTGVFMNCFCLLRVYFVTKLITFFDGNEFMKGEEASYTLAQVAARTT